MPNWNCNWFNENFNKIFQIIIDSIKTFEIIIDLIEIDEIVIDVIKIMEIRIIDWCISTETKRWVNYKIGVTIHPIYIIGVTRHHKPIATGDKFINTTTAEIPNRMMQNTYNDTIT